jgi:hypothetical protein
MAGPETNLYRRHNSDKRARQSQQTRAGAAILRTGWAFSVANIGFLIKP